MARYLPAGRGAATAPGPRGQGRSHAITLVRKGAE
jgi:hypothetical protein